MDAIKSDLRGFLARHLRGREVDDEEDLFGLGVVNSLFTLELVTFVEKKFGIAIEGDDVDIDNFKSIGAISRLVERKRR